MFVLSVMMLFCVEPTSGVCLSLFMFICLMSMDACGSFHVFTGFLRFSWDQHVRITPMYKLKSRFSSVFEIVFLHALYQSTGTVNSKVICNAGLFLIVS